jgi:hypothetical protein
VGSGHFLIGAAHRLAKRLAAVRTGDAEPSPEAYRTALRDCIRNCLYGVDLNPMAAELCRVALWLESMEPGKPLSFLDHHIKIGNSLLGATPALLAKGVPDEAFDAIEGDDKKLCTRFKKANKKEREDAKNKQATLFAPPIKLGNLTTVYAALSALPDDSLAQVAAKADRYESLVSSNDYKFGRLLADAWCAAFVWKKTPEFDFPITEEVFRAIEQNPHSAAPWMLDEITRLAKQYKFFHWHLEFPDVFGAAAAEPQPGAITPASLPPADRAKATNEQMGWTGGFDCILGNPVWETLQMNEQEFFAQRAPEIADAPNAAARKKLIAELPITQPNLDREWADAFRESEGSRQLIRESGRFPLTAVGKINTSSLFSELNRLLLAPTGYAAFVIPSGLATDDTTKHFFDNLLECKSLQAFLELENERFFQGIGQGHMVRFAITTVLGAAGKADAVRFLFQGHSLADLKDDTKLFRLSAQDFRLLNPNTRTAPIFRTGIDAEINKLIYRRLGVFWDETLSDGNRWDIAFMQGAFNMATDSGLFRTRAELEHPGLRLEGNAYTDGIQQFLPLYEAKMLSTFNHRYAGYTEVLGSSRQHVLPATRPELLADPSFETIPFYWVSEADLEASLAGRPPRKWLFAWRDVTDARASARCMVPCIIPRCPTGHGTPLLFSGKSAPMVAALYGCLASFALDYVAKQKVGGLHLNYSHLKQLAVPHPEILTRECPWCPDRDLVTWLLPRVLELTYTAWDLEPFANDCGYEGPPFVWEEDRRFQLRAELDAAFFHLYLGTPEEWNRTASDALKSHLLTPRDAVSHILETFPIVKKKDLASFGTFRTKDTILSIYDDLATAITASTLYQNNLSPPPADPWLRYSP